MNIRQRYAEITRAKKAEIKAQQIETDRVLEQAKLDGNMELVRRIEEEKRIAAVFRRQAKESYGTLRKK